MDAVRVYVLASILAFESGCADQGGSSPNVASSAASSRPDVDAAAAAEGRDGAAAGSQFHEQVVRSNADYPEYRTLDEIFGAAELVVRVRVEESPPHPGDEHGLVTTVYGVQVDRVYKGAAMPGQVIEVKQLGGESMGVIYQEDDEIPLKLGATYVLFLAVYPDSPASLINPGQGQYLTDDSGMLTQVSRAGVDLIPVTVGDLQARSSGMSP